MSAKTCQLCGKPLGRMRGDGDFCSREHRTQFRLRRGMDRLEEANKVASLMRRRDSPKQIPTSQLLASAGEEGRTWLDAVPYQARPVELGFSPLAPVLFQPRVPDRPERFANPLSDLSRRSAVAADRVLAPASLPFVRRPSSAPVLGSLKAVRPTVGVVQAQLTSILRRVPAPQDVRRECGAALRVSRRAGLPTGRFVMETPGGNLNRTRQLRALTADPAVSAAAQPRVSPRIHFQKRTMVARHGNRSLRSSAELAGPQLPQLAPPQAFDISIEVRMSSIPRAEIDLRIPPAPPPRTNVGTRHGEAARLQPSAYETAVPAAPRVLVAAWISEAPVSTFVRRHTDIRHGGIARANALFANLSCDTEGEHRVAAVRFVPTDSGFAPAPIALRGSFGADSNESVQPAIEPIEEHFNAGLEQWVGDTADWRLDAAGARPGGLALFQPTLELGDYEFEFFTRIETRAVTFVFRASNTSNYHKVSIAMVESGRYELQRRTVIGGIEEPAVVAPLPGVLRSGAAFTVKTRAWQNDFTICLDGEMACRWTDGRLPTGGIGFLTARDDRARVYWVRVSQPDTLNSPAATLRPARSIQ